MLFYDNQTFLLLKNHNLAHLWCTEVAHSASAVSFPYFESLVCGLPLEQSPIRALLSTAQLIHFFVISGLHLTLVEYSTRRLGRIIQSSVLIALWLMSGCGIPATRALVSFGLKSYSARSGLKKWKHEVLATALCFLWCQDTYELYSLMLSTAGATAIQSRSLQSHSWTKANIWCWICMFPWLVHLTGTIPTPFHIILQMLVAPFFTYVLLPLTGIGFSLLALEYSFFPIPFSSQITLALELTAKAFSETVRIAFQWLPQPKLSVSLNSEFALTTGCALVLVSLFRIASQEQPPPSQYHLDDTNPSASERAWMVIQAVFLTAICSFHIFVSSGTSSEPQSRQTSPKCNEAELRTQAEIIKTSSNAVNRVGAHLGHRSFKVTKQQWPCHEKRTMQVRQVR